MLPDVQNTRGDFGYSLRAGVQDLIMPILVKDRDGDLISTIARVDMSVMLREDLRGINMSRLPIILNQMHEKMWVIDNLKPTLIDMLKIMETTEAEVSFTFPYFYNQAAPVTGHRGKAHVSTRFMGRLNGETGDFQLQLTVGIPVMTLCPCSKEISENNAHNQRATVEMTVDYGHNFVWIEELIEYAESSASSALYPILKREDEKYVTEHAYNKPRFVEDLVREVASKLDADERIRAFRVSVTSQESIHQHDAVAEIRKGL